MPSRQGGSKVLVVLLSKIMLILIFVFDDFEKKR